MAELVTGQEEKKVIPFLKFGAFDAENFPAKKVKEIIANEEKFGTVRLLEGSTITGKITGVYSTKHGDVVYLSDVIGAGETSAVKLNLTKNLKYGIARVKKINEIDAVATDALSGLLKDSKVSITYEGRQSLSKNNPDIVGHKFTVAELEG